MILTCIFLLCFGDDCRQHRHRMFNSNYTCIQYASAVAKKQDARLLYVETRNGEQKEKRCLHKE